MVGSDPGSYYYINSILKRHGYNIDELENMISWERDVYITFVEKEIEEKNKQIESMMKT